MINVGKFEVLGKAHFSQLFIVMKKCMASF